MYDSKERKKEKSNETTHMLILFKDPHMGYAQDNQSY